MKRIQFHIEVVGTARKIRMLKETNKRMKFQREGSGMRIQGQSKASGHGPEKKDCEERRIFDQITGRLRKQLRRRRLKKRET